MAIAQSVSGSNNVIELIFQATDQASESIKSVGSSILSISNLAAGAQSAAAQLGSTLFSVATNAGNGMLGLVNVFQSLQAILETPLISPYLQSLENYVELLKEDAGELSNTLESLSTVANPFFTGITGIATSASNKFTTAFDSIDSKIRSTINYLESLPSAFNSALGAIGSPAEYLSGLDEPLAVFNLLEQSVLQVSNGLFELGQRLTFITLGFQALQQITSKPFEIFLKQNIELREQLLATQASIASTSKVIANGVEIKDSRLAIESLTTGVNSAIREIREGSLDLVGVTSQELVPLFQQVTQFSSQIGASLGDSSQLALSFAAALGTLQIPLFQSRQEIQSILTGTIDINSVLAKSIGLQNDQLKLWIAQGTVVPNLLKKLEAFRSGNLLAAQTFGGVTSNIQEVFDEITRRAGEPLLSPLINEATKFYEYLKGNTQELSETVSNLIKNITSGFGQVSELASKAASSLGPLLQDVINYLTRTAGSAIGFFVDALKTGFTILEPAINLLKVLVGTVTTAAGPFLKLAITVKVLQAGVSILATSFSILANVLPVVGEILFVLTGRANSMLNLLTNLNLVVGTGTSGFLVLSQVLAKIPGGLNAISAQFGALGPLLVPFIPAIGSFGISLTALAGKFPLVKLGLTGLIQSLPSVAGNLSILAKGASFVKGTFEPLAPFFSSLSDQLGKLSGITDLGAIANEKFAIAMQGLGASLRATVANTVLVVAGAGSLLFLLNELVLKSDNFKIALKGLYEGAQQVAKAIGFALSNPISQAILTVGALALLIQSQLIPALVESATAFAAGAVTRYTEAVASLSSVLGVLSRTKALDLAGIFAGDAVAAFSKVTQATNAQILASNLSSQAQLRLISVNSALRVSMLNSAAGLNIFQLALVRLPAAIAAIGKAITGLIAATGPLVLPILAVTTAIEAFGATQSILSRGQEKIKAVGDGIAEVEKKTASLYAQLGKPISTSNIDLYVESLKKIRDSQGGITNFLDSLRQGDGVAGVFALAVRPAQLLANAINIIRGEKGVQLLDSGVTQAQAAYNQELIATTEALDKIDRKIESFGPRRQKQAEQERELAKLQKQLSEAIARGDEDQRKRLEIKIKRQQEVVQAAKDEIQAVIDIAEKTEAPDLQTQERKAKILATLKNIRDQYEAINRIETSQQDLPFKGTAAQQLAVDAEAAIAAVERTTGLPEDFATKSKLLLDTTKTQLDLNLINAEEAVRRYRLLVRNAYADSSTQIAAQKALEEAQNKGLEETLQEGVTLRAEYQRRQAEGAIDALTAERQQEEIRKRGFADQLKGLKDREDAKLDTLKQSQTAAIFELDKQVRAASLTAEETGSKKDLEALSKVQERRKSLEESYDNERLEIQQDYAQQRAELEAKGAEDQRQATERISKAQLDQELTAIQAGQQEIAKKRQLGLIDAITAEKELSQLRDREGKAQLENLKRVEADRIKISKAAQAGILADLDSKISDARQAKDAEAIQKLQAERSQSEKIFRDQQKLLSTEFARTRSEIEVKSLEAQQQDRLKILQLEQDKALDIVREAESGRQIALRRLRQQGVITEAELQDRLGAIAQEGTRAELKLEREKLALLQRNARLYETEIRQSRQRINQLILKTIEDENQAYESQINLLKDKLERLTLGRTNELQEQVALLEKQKSLIDAQGQAYEQQARLLQASNDVIKAGENSFTKVLEVIGQQETSERRRQQIVQITAAIKYESTLNELNLQEQIAKIEEQKNRSALERKSIENEIAILKQRGDVLRGQDELTIAQRQLRDRKITKDQFDSLRLQQQGRIDQLDLLQQNRGLIGQERATFENILPFQAEQRRLQRQAALFEAGSNLIDSQPEGRQKLLNQRNFRQQSLNQLGFADINDVIKQLLPNASSRVGEVSGTAQRERDRRGQDVIDFGSEGNPRVQELLKEFERSRRPQPVEVLPQVIRREFEGPRKTLPGQVVDLGEGQNQAQQDRIQRLVNPSQSLPGFTGGNLDVLRQLQLPSANELSRRRADVPTIDLKLETNNRIDKLVQQLEKQYNAPDAGRSVSVEQNNSFNIPITQTSSSQQTASNVKDEVQTGIQAVIAEAKKLLVGGF